MMDIAATITGYLLIFALTVLVIVVALYYGTNKVMDVLGVRKEYFKMKGQRDRAWLAIRNLQRRHGEG